MPKKKILMIDNNLALDHAVALAQEFEVLYAPAGSTAYPLIQEQVSGDGFPITYVEDWGNYIYSADMIYIVDCFMGGTADRLREEGIIVFGPSSEWTKIENDRPYGWKTLKDMGVGVPEGAVVKGIKGVMDYIESNMDKKQKDRFELSNFFIKVNKYRGNFNSMAVKTPQEAETAIMQAGYGPYVNDLVFLVQKGSSGVEIGLDIFINGKDFIYPYQATIEVKGSGTLLKNVMEWSADKLILDKIKPSLIKSGYRGTVSFEFLWDGKKVSVIDVTSRNAFPCSSMQAKYIENYPEVIWKVAHGEDVRVEIRDDYEYSAEITVATENEKTWRTIRFPKEMKDNVGFRRVVNKDGDYWLVPGDSVAAVALAQGDTYTEALETAGKVAKEIVCSETYYDADIQNEITSVIEKLKEYGGEDFNF